jgi:hypothetical protein
MRKSTPTPERDERRRQFPAVLATAEADGEVHGVVTTGEIAAELDRMIADTAPGA